MREFIKDNKYNFIDKNDVLVGFDNDQQCCESFGWFYSNSRPKSYDTAKITPKNLEAFNFDPDYVKTVNLGGERDGVTFRLENDEGNVLYLTLHNAHNGYYSHGFTFENKNEIIKSGRL